MSGKKFFVDGADKIRPPVNDTPYRKIFAVGDVHGHFDKLMSLWKKLPVTDDDLIIFLGDYIDRGSKVAETLDWVFKHGGRKNFVFLRGNHEQMMLNAFSGTERDFTEKFLSVNTEHVDSDEVMRHGETLAWICFNGGDNTIRAILNLQRAHRCKLDDVLNFARNLPLSYTLTIGGRQYFFCHAGVDGSKPLDAQEDEFLLWAREKFFNRYDGDAVIIGGHTPIQSFEEFGGYENPRPIKIPDRNILLMDTGSFIRGGKVSAVDILSGEFWQSDNATGGVMFVCAWNTCRSAMAEYIMRHLLTEAGLAEKIRVDSSGCITEGGEPIGFRTRKVLAANGIPIGDHMSKTFTTHDYKTFDRIIALDRGVLRLLKNKCGGDPYDKICLLTDAHGVALNVEDPGASGTHDKTFADILSGCRVLLKELTAK